MATKKAKPSKGKAGKKPALQMKVLPETLPLTPPTTNVADATSAMKAYGKKKELEGSGICPTCKAPVTDHEWHCPAAAPKKPTPPEAPKTHELATAKALLFGEKFGKALLFVEQPMAKQGPLYVTPEAASKPDEKAAAGVKAALEQLEHGSVAALPTGDGNNLYLIVVHGHASKSSLHTLQGALHKAGVNALVISLAVDETLSVYKLQQALLAKGD